MTATTEDRRAPIRDPGSFRDPSGFVFTRDGVLFRQVNAAFAADWDDLVASGLLADAPGPRAADRPRARADRARRRTGHRPRADPPGADRLHLVSVRVVIRHASGRRARHARGPGARRRAGLHAPRCDGLQRPVPQRSAHPDRHALVRTRRAGGALDRLSPVLRAVPRAARADGPPRRPPRADAAGLHRRDPARSRGPAAAGAHALEPRTRDAHPRPRPAPRRRFARSWHRGGRGDEEGHASARFASRR